MKTIFCLLTALLLVVSLQATNCHTYANDEYITVANGISPDGCWAITAHGKGELGYDHFHIYLTDAITGKKVGPLEKITNTLDTGASSFAAKWSPDSTNVTVIYRIDRHLPLKAVTFRIKNHRAYRLEGPVNATEEQLQFWQTSCQVDFPSPKIFGGTQ